MLDKLVKTVTVVLQFKRLGMEALPFLPFIQIPPKLTEINVTPSFSGAIRVAISQTGRNPDDFLTGLREFETLRNAMIVAIGDSAIHKSFLAGPRHGLTSDVPDFVEKFSELSVAKLKA